MKKRLPLAKPVLLLLFSACFLGIRAQPVVTSFTPASGPIGSIVTVSGSNFSTVAASNIVFFGATQATVTNATATQLKVKVPAGATYKPITVQVNGLLGYSVVPFCVTFTSGGFINSSSFAPHVDFPAGYSPVSLDIKDLDGDGLPDLSITENQIGTVSVLRNNSVSGSMDLAVAFHQGPSSLDVETEDLDGDGKPELILASTAAEAVSIFKNTSVKGTIDASSFASPVKIMTVVIAETVSVADVDGDGKPDILAPLNPSGMIIYRNVTTLGSITLSSFVPFSFPGITGSFADIDNDGKPDVVSSGTNKLVVFKNTSTVGSISFAPEVDFSTPNSVKLPVTGDINGDGKLDIIGTDFITNNAVVMINTGTAGNITAATFSSAQYYTFPVGNNPVESAVGDVDGDGLIDITTINENSDDISILKNTSTSTTNISFAPAFNITVGGLQPKNLAIGDLNGDGRPELSATVEGGYNSQVAVLQNLMLDPPGGTIEIDQQPSDLSLCAGQTGELTISASGTTNITYQWQYSPDGISPFVDVTGGAYSGAQTATLSIDSEGNNVEGKYQCVMNGDGATTVISTMVAVDILSVPEAPATTGGSGCAGTTITVTASGAADGSYRWYTTETGNNLINGQVNSTYSAELATTTTFYASISNGACESSRTSVLATVVDTGCLGNVVGSPPTITPEELATTTGGVVTLDLVSLITTDGSPLNISSLQILKLPVSGAKATINASGILTVSYAGLVFSGTESITIQACDVDDDCSSQEFDIVVSDVQDIIIWNAVSPGGPNPTLFIQYIESNPKTNANKVTIFDRWQNQVWHGSNYDNSNVLFSGISDGGTALPTGVYFYKIEFVSGMKTKTGFISLRR